MRSRHWEATRRDSVTCPDEDAPSGRRGSGYPDCARWVGGSPAVAPGHDHDCIVGTPPRAIDWSALRNPILSFPKIGVKDQALQWSGGAWHMLYSDMVETTSAPHVRFSVAISSSADLMHWTSPRIVASNAASPDIVEIRRPIHRHVPDTLGLGVPNERWCFVEFLVNRAPPWSWIGEPDD